MPDAAFDATADALTRGALGALPPDRPRTRADIARLAAPVAHLLEAQLDGLATAPTSPYVDPDDPAVAAAGEVWRHAARAAARFPAHAWAAAVERATVLALAHLVRPAETLAAAAFEDVHGPIPSATALDRVRAFGPYPYLPEIAERYVERKALETLDRAGLEQLLRRIDRRLVSAFGPAEWSTLLGPLFDLAGPVGSPTGTIPAALLRDLFEAKGVPALAAVFADLDAVGPATLRERLGETLAPRPAPRVATAPPDLAPPPLPPVAEGVRPPVIGSAYAASAFDDDPIDSEILGPPRPAGSTPPSKPVEAPEAIESVPEAADLDAPMEAVREAVTEPAAAPPPPAAPVPADATPFVFPAPTAVDDDDDVLAALAPRPTTPPPSEPPQFIPDDADGDPFRPAAAPPEPVTPPPPATPAAAARAEADDDEPLWKRLARERDAEPAPPPPVADDEPLWRRFARSDLAARLPSAPAEPAPSVAPASPATATPPPPAEGDGHAPSPELDVLEARVLGPDAHDRRDWYVADLFEGSPGAYHRTLDQLDRASTYTDATAVFSAEVLRRHRVNPYTDAAVAFIDAVQAQFDRRG